jgi:hypothetical protein
MFSLRAIHLLIKYFNSIDKKLSNYLIRKQPWDEESLTRIFCDLLDHDYQEEENIDYTLAQLYSDLSKSDDPIAIDISIETHPYTKKYEHNVAKSDMGMILEYQDQFERKNSFKSYLLFQAKRLFPVQNEYTVKSKFNSFNESQHDEIVKINKWAGDNFVSYLLYCPRPERLDKATRERLAYARNEAFGDNIFDFALGQELRDDLLHGSKTIAAGIFVSEVNKMPCEFYDIHKSMFQDIFPFSWFIVKLFQGFNDRSFLNKTKYIYNYDHNENDKIKVMREIVEGKLSYFSKRVLDDVLGINEVSINENIYPKHTLRIKIVNGTDRNNYLNKRF